MIDIAGRRVWAREAVGIGSHAERVGVLRPGLYLVRLRQGSRLAATRAVVVE